MEDLINMNEIDWQSKPSEATEDIDGIQALKEQFKLWADDLDSGVIPEIHLTMYEIGTIIEALNALRREYYNGII